MFLLHCQALSPLLVQNTDEALREILGKVLQSMRLPNAQYLRPKSK